MRHAINLPPFGPLADPSALSDIAQAAEQHGFDGYFLWDHVLSPVPGSWDIADPWVALAAAAACTKAIRIGPMVTPLPRKMIAELCRQTVTLDRLSSGRLTLGIGAGGDQGREFSGFGDHSDPARRARQLDQAADVLLALWSGRRVDHDDEFVVDAVTMTPGPVQVPRIPVWTACRSARPAVVDRAARFDGVFPLDLSDDELSRLLSGIEAQRGTLDGFDIAMAAHPGTHLRDLQARGATWALHSFWPGHRPEQVLRFIARGIPE